MSRTFILSQLFARTDPHSAPGKIVNQIKQSEFVLSFILVAYWSKYNTQSDGRRRRIAAGRRWWRRRRGKLPPVSCDRRRHLRAVGRQSPRQERLHRFPAAGGEEPARRQSGNHANRYKANSSSSLALSFFSLSLSLSILLLFCSMFIVIFLLSLF